MSVVYRYDPTCGSYCNGPRMECCKDGDWVAVEDYESAEKQKDSALKEVERLREAARQIAATIERAADVKAASVVLGEPIGGSAVVYDLRRFAAELRQAVEVKPCKTTNC